MISLYISPTLRSIEVEFRGFLALNSITHTNGYRLWRMMGMWEFEGGLTHGMQKPFPLKILFYLVLIHYKSHGARIVWTGACWEIVVLRDGIEI